MEKKKFVSEVIENNTQKTVPKIESTTDENITKYINSLNSLEKIAYEIAKTRLKSSFDIEKSIGYKSFTGF